MNRDIIGRFDPYPQLLPLDVQKGNLDIIAQDDGLARLPCQDKHIPPLKCLKCEVPKVKEYFFEYYLIFLTLGILGTLGTFHQVYRIKSSIELPVILVAVAYEAFKAISFMARL